MDNGEAVAAGPQGRIPDSEEEYPGAFVLVNWDDDDADGGPVTNEAQWVEPVPDMSDDETDLLVAGEDNLMGIMLNYPRDIAGTLELTASAGADKIRLRSHPEGGVKYPWPQQWQLPGAPPDHDDLYIEGIKPSASVADVKLQLKFTAQCRSFTDVVYVTVVMIRLGNASYRHGMTPYYEHRGHSAVITGFTGECTPSSLGDDLNFVIHEATSEYTGWQGIQTQPLDTMTHKAGHPCWGCFCTYDVENGWGSEYSKRLRIIRVPKYLASLGIGYSLSILEPDTWHAATQKLAGIDQLRCDGLVEVAYEYNGLPVWGALIPQNGGTLQYDICDQGNAYTYQSTLNCWIWLSGGNSVCDVLERHCSFGWIAKEPCECDGENETAVLWPPTQCGHVVLTCGTSTKMVRRSLCTPVGTTGGN